MRTLALSIFQARRLSKGYSQNWAQHVMDRVLRRIKLCERQFGSVSATEHG